MLKKIFEKDFLRNFLYLSIPFAIQNVLTSSVNLLDNIMVGKLGEKSIAAVSLANRPFFVFTLMTFGISGGCSIFISQYWGKRDEKGIKSVVFLNTVISLMASIIFLFLTTAFPQNIMGLFSKEADVILEGTNYLRVIGVSALFYSISFIFTTVLKATQSPIIPMAMGGVSLVTNGILNYCLIFGKLGFPALGTLGAAYATLISRIIECALTVFLTLATKEFLMTNLREYFAIKKDLVVKFIKTAYPVFVSETLWGLGVSIYSAVYGRMGKNFAAAANVASTMEQVATFFVFGAGLASGVMVGKEIGAKNKERAYDYTLRFSILNPLCALFFVALVIIFAPFFIKIFNLTSQTRTIAHHLILICAFYLPFKTVTLTHIVGTLRNSGDTLFCFFMDFMGVWFIGVPLTIFTGLYLKLPMEAVYFLSMVEEIIKSVFVLKRVLSKTYIKDLVN
mgnify:FL=1